MYHKAFIINLFLLWASLPLIAQCLSGGHSNHPNDNWLSCNTSANAAGRIGHWIQYDFGDTYELLYSHFWNYNVPDQLEKGFKEVAFDYSLDGVNWTSFGVYTFNIASGTNDYQGESGPSFNGIQAKYLLMTAINSQSENICNGFGEFKIEVKNCSKLQSGADLKNVTCNNGASIQLNPQGGIAPFAIQWADAGSETFRSNLNVGNYTVSITDAKGCQIVQNINIPLPQNSTDIRQISNRPLLRDTFEHTGIIQSNGFIPNNHAVGFRATNSISLLPGFQVNSGGQFFAKIINCVPNTPAVDTIEAIIQSRIAPKQPIVKVEKILPSLAFLVHPNPFSEQTTIDLSLKKTQTVTITLYSLLGNQIATILKNKVLESGTHQYVLKQNNLSSGMYIIKIHNGQVALSQKVIID